MSSSTGAAGARKWIDGYVDGKRIRQSAKTRSREQAERKARSLEDASDPAKPSQPKVTTIADADAVDAFKADERGGDLSKETTKQSKTFFEKQLLLQPAASLELSEGYPTWQSTV